MSNNEKTASNTIDLTEMEITQQPFYEHNREDFDDLLKINDDLLKINEDLLKANDYRVKSAFNSLKVKSKLYIKKLHINTPYNIMKAKRVEGKFGTNVMVELDNHFVFLDPLTTSNIMSQEDLDALLKDIEGDPDMRGIVV